MEEGLDLIADSAHWLNHRDTEVPVKFFKIWEDVLEPERPGQETEPIRVMEKRCLQTIKKRGLGHDGAEVFWDGNRLAPYPHRTGFRPVSTDQCQTCVMLPDAQSMSQCLFCFIHSLCHSFSSSPCTVMWDLWGVSFFMHSGISRMHKS